MMVRSRDVKDFMRTVGLTLLAWAAVVVVAVKVKGDPIHEDNPNHARNPYGS